MANFIEFVVRAGMIVMMLCQDGSPTQARKICLLVCKEHLNGFPVQTRQVNSKFVRQCDCARFYSNSRRRRSVYSSTNPSTISSNNTDNTTEFSTSKPTEQVKDESKYCSYKKPSVRRVKTMNESELLAPNIAAKFYKNNGIWWANVTWSPPEDTSFTKYLVDWKGRDDRVRCRALPKNVTSIVLGSPDGWIYPKVLYVFVVILEKYAAVSDIKIDYKDFRPPIPPGIPVTLEPPRDHEIQRGVIIGGVLAGIFCIVVLLVLLYKRKSCGGSQPIHHIIVPMQENNNADALKNKKIQNIDTFFASYLPESEKYSNDVATIAYKLGQMGYKVVFDKVDSVRMNEIGFNMWVDKQILEAKKYIVFCSSGYVRLWQSLAGSTSGENKFNHVSDQDLVRVRYEIKRISDVYSEKCSTSRIVCIKMDSKMSTKLLPPWMNHNMLLWPEQKEDIIRRLNDQAAMVMNV